MHIHICICIYIYMKYENMYERVYTYTLTHAYTLTHTYVKTSLGNEAPRFCTYIELLNCTYIELLCRLDQTMTHMAAHSQYVKTICENEEPRCRLWIFLFVLAQMQFTT